jgi:hypothetical protein
MAIAFGPWVQRLATALETSFGELHARIDDVESRRPLVDVLLTEPRGAPHSDSARCCGVPP